MAAGRRRWLTSIENRPGAEWWNRPPAASADPAQQTVGYPKSCEKLLDQSCKATGFARATVGLHCFLRLRPHRAVRQGMLRLGLAQFLCGNFATRKEQAHHRRPEAANQPLRP